jgi:ribosomal protein S18 acetylase RimI-like enzyme
MVIRPGTPDDVPFLEAMLLEAFFWDPAVRRTPVDSLRSDSEFVKLLASWGRPGDRAVIAVDGGTEVGAAWFRLWTPNHNSYGFVDASTPEVAMAVRLDHRGKGIGRALLTALIASARDDGFSALSLSVNPRNPARALYESLGFTKGGEAGTSWTLRLPLGTRSS